MGVEYRNFSQLIFGQNVFRIVPDTLNGKEKELKIALSKIGSFVGEE